jgi:cysteinyl-tRNA synthetase
MLRIYDTRARQVEEIAPARAMRMYTCGPTVHRRAHLGDLRSHLLSDLIRRILERQRTRLVVCRSISDLNGFAPAAGGRPALEVAREHEDAFRQDSGALNLRPPEHSPRASETVEPMIELIAKLIERGHAYATQDGSVFFAAATFPTYGEISGNGAEAGAPGDPSGRSPADWALWRPSEGDPSRDSPWGRGSPSHHVECSALALRFLGERIDLHTGAADLAFPHDEDERAQSDSAAGHEVVRRWVHGEPPLFDGRPMGDGDAVTLSGVIGEGLDPLAVRLAFLERHYRERIDLNWDTLRAADRTLRRWRARVAEWSESASAPMAAEHLKRIEAALDDDLDTPSALRGLRELERDPAVAPGSKLESFLHLDHMLALDLSTEIGRAPALPPGAGELLARREAAREAGDEAAAERLRAELADLGVRVSDTDEGQLWS